MEKFKSLAESLGVADPRPPADIPGQEFNSLVDITDPVEFCKRVLETREFRQYIMHGVVLGTVPAVVMTRIMDHAWGQPPKRIEHTGADGGPIEAVAEIRRVIVKAEPFGEMPEAPVVRKELTH